MRNLVMVLIAASLSVDLLAADIESYVYSLGGSRRTVHMKANVSIRELKKLPQGHYFWFHRGGEGFMIRDAATLAVIDKIFAEGEKLRPEYDVLRKRMRPIEIREGELDRAVDRIDEEIDTIEDTEERLSSADREKIRELRDRRRLLQDKLRQVAAELRVLEREEVELDRRSDALEKEAERKLVPVIDDAVRRGVAVPTSHSLDRR